MTPSLYIIKIVEHITRHYKYYKHYIYKILRCQTAHKAIMFDSPGTWDRKIRISSLPVICMFLFSVIKQTEKKNSLLAIDFRYRRGREKRKMRVRFE